jgi:hypothetical protein
MCPAFAELPQSELESNDNQGAAALKAAIDEYTYVGPGTLLGFTGLGG